MKINQVLFLAAMAMALTEVAQAANQSVFDQFKCIGRRAEDSALSPSAAQLGFGNDIIVAGGLYKNRALEISSYLDGKFKLETSSFSSQLNSLGLSRGVTIASETVQGTVPVRASVVIGQALASSGTAFGTLVISAGKNEEQFAYSLICSL